MSSAEGQGLASPSPVGLGIDAVDLDRFRTALSRTPGIETRVFTPGESTYAARYRDPVPRLAARFAAKEAAMKALGVGLGAFSLRDVEVLSEGLGPPSLSLKGAAARLAREAGFSSWRVSLTHSGTLAEAIVLAVGTARASTRN